MPGIYGVYSHDPQVHDEVRSYFRGVWGECDEYQDGDWLLGGHSFEKTSSIRSIGRARVGCDGEPVSYRRLSSLTSVPDSTGSLATLLRGNAFCLSQPDHILRLECHESGYIPLYWHKSDGLLVFSSNLRLFRRIVGDQPDPASAVSFMMYGYTIGDNSPFQHVKRMRPGQVLRFYAASDQISVHDSSGLWQSEGRERPLSEDRDPVELVWSQLVNAVDASFGSDDRPAIMLSGGWDSRTLLAATLETSRKPIGYVHGDPDSREIALVRRITKNLGLDLIVEPIDDRCLDADWLDSRFERTENLVFPHWHRAGQLLGSYGIFTVASGVFGEVLGGHYGPSMVLNGWKKAVTVARELIWPENAEFRTGTIAPEDTVADLIHPAQLTRPYYVNQDWWKTSGNIDSQIRGSKERVLGNYLERGIREPTELVEAFVSEHRGAQYIAAQPISFRATMSAVQPFVESEILRTASNIPLALKIHNTLNRRLLSEFCPDLIEYPMAATLVRAKRSIMIQESSRLVRRTGQAVAERVQRLVPDHVGTPRMSWVNFEFMRDSENVGLLIDSLTAPIWDRVALHEKADRLATRSPWPRPHGFFDQLMKIYTVDSLFRSGVSRR